MDGAVTLARLLFGGALLLPACGDPAIEQPLPFSHSVHVGKREIACTECHVGVENAARAGLPALRRCLACHIKPQGDPPSQRERIVRKMAVDGTPLRWNQVTQNAGHVYFSHRVHVSLAGMSCVRCHGDVTQWERPPSRPMTKLLSMDSCMNCHRRKGASNDCAVCHK